MSRMYFQDICPDRLGAADDEDEDDKILKDGERVHVPLYLVDSDGHALTDAFGQPLDAKGGRRSGYVFASDADRGMQRALDRDYHKAELSARWKGGLEAGDQFSFGARTVHVDGWDDNDKVVLSDADAVDGETLKQQAYDAAVHELSNAWRSKSMKGDEEGGACAVGGSPGKWVREGGKLVCKPLGKPDDNEFALAGPLSDAQSAEIRREAYEQSCADLRDAWRRR